MGTSGDETDLTVDAAQQGPTTPQPKRTKIRVRGGIPGARDTDARQTGANQQNDEVTDKDREQLADEIGQSQLLTDLVRALVATVNTQATQMHTQAAQMENLIEQIGSLRAQVAELTEEIHTQSTLSSTEPSISYANVARTPPTSRPSNIRSLSSNSTKLPAASEALYCTIDTSRVEEDAKIGAQPGNIRRAIEGEMQKEEGQENWKCVAVLKDARNADRIRVICRDETELAKVKNVAQRTTAAGARVLRDQWFPVKVDNANRTAILDHEGKVREGAAEALGKENGVQIAKLAWLSRKDTGKAYGSMVIYLTRNDEAKRLLQNQYFHVSGESAYTRTFEPRTGPIICYRCQGIGHRAFACTKPQVCARCAQEGHHYSSCQATIEKCAHCSGPHEAFSKNCRTTHPAQNE
jgi:hypothetical protein